MILIHLNIQKVSLSFQIKIKNVLGKFADELHGEIIKEIICMKSKVYAYKTKKKKLKGCSKTIIKKELYYEDYYNILNSTNELNKKQH